MIKRKATVSQPAGKHDSLVSCRSKVDFKKLYVEIRNEIPFCQQSEHVNHIVIVCLTGLYAYLQSAHNWPT